MSELYYRVTIDELNEIYQFHYNYTGDKRTRYIWEWEYGKDNPQKSILLSVKDNGKVIATQGMITIKVAFGEKTYVTGKNESLLIDSNFRGKSLSTRFYKYAISEYEKEGISCLWGFSRKAIIPLKKANFVVFENIIKRMVLPIKFKQAQTIIPKSTANSLKSNIFKMVVFFATIYSKIRIILVKENSFKSLKNIELVNNLKNQNDIINMYIQIKIKHADLIHIYQDKEYFDWRIRNSPFPIKTLFLYENNQLKGYFYLKIQEKFCELTDFTFVQKIYGKILIRELINLIKNQNLGFVFYTGNIKNKLNRTVFKLLRYNGFLKIKGPNHFVLRNFNFQNKEYLFKIENWYLNDLWSEGI